MGTRPFKTELDLETFKQRVSEMGASLARESDLADTLGQALAWYLRDQNIPARQAADEALASWKAARRV